MGTGTISLADDASERLRRENRDGESFNDVVRRLTAGVSLAECYGVLDESTADELAEVVAERRRSSTDEYESRVRRIEDLAELT